MIRPSIDEMLAFMDRCAKCSWANGNISKETSNVDVRAAIREILENQPKYDALVEELGGLARRGHYYSDDCWYSCPMAAGGCCDESKGSGCTCGADKHNAKVDAALAAIRKAK